MSRKKKPFWVRYAAVACLDIAAACKIDEDFDTEALEEWIVKQGALARSAAGGDVLVVAFEHSCDEGGPDAMQLLLLLLARAIEKFTDKIIVQDVESNLPFDPDNLYSLADSDGFSITDIHSSKYYLSDVWTGEQTVSDALKEIEDNLRCTPWIHETTKSKKAKAKKA